MVFSGLFLLRSCFCLYSLEDYEAILKGCDQVIRKYILKFRGESLNLTGEGVHHHFLESFAVLGGERFLHPSFLLTGIWLTGC